MSTIAAPKKTYEVVAILLLLPALIIQLKYLNLLSNETTDLSSNKMLVAISLICSVLAIVFASKSFNQTKMIWRISSFLIVFVGSLIALISIFQLF